MDNCMVCKTETEHNSSSPFMPYSGLRCLKCCKEHLIPLEDLMSLLQGLGKAKSYQERKEEWIEWFGRDDGYAEKYWIPTAKFFGMTVEEAWENYQLNCKRCPYNYFSNGLRADLEKQHKHIPACCGKRNYKCPKCGHIITLSKVKSRRG